MLARAFRSSLNSGGRLPNTRTTLRLVVRTLSSNESLRTIYPPACHDRGLDAVSDPVWNAELLSTAGERSSGGRLSGHPSAGGVSGSKSRYDSEQHRDPARTSVHADQ